MKHIKLFESFIMNEGDYSRIEQTARKVADDLGAYSVAHDDPADRLDVVRSKKIRKWLNSNKWFAKYYIDELTLSDNHFTWDQAIKRLEHEDLKYETFSDSKDGNSYIAW